MRSGALSIFYNIQTNLKFAAYRYVHASRWASVKAWFFNGGKTVPGMGWKSGGDYIEDSGPIKFEGVAREDVFKEMEKLQEYADRGGGVAAQGCPFKF